MRPILILLAAAIGLAACDIALAAPGPDAEARYQALLAQAKTDPPGFDWQALRLAFAGRPSFHVFAQSSAKRLMFQAAQTGDCASQLTEAKAVIDETFVDADAHFLAAYCEDKGGDTAAAHLDRDIAGALVRSIQTGDGLSTTTAFTPISVDEEYTVMRAMGLRVTSQALQRGAGHSYDVLGTVDAKGQAATYYFLIDRVLAAESASLTPGAVSEGGPPDRTP